MPTYTCGHTDKEYKAKGLCKNCYQRMKYARNPEYGRGYQAKSRAKRNAWLAEQKRRPCADCGNTFPTECMDFDHRSDKQFTIAESWNRCRPLDTLITEIAKCDVVCANCHRIRTRSNMLRK